MIPEKIELTKVIKSIIANSRKDTGLSSYDFSEKIGKSKYWISNIENGKAKFIAKEDLCLIIKTAKGVSDQEIEAMLTDILTDNVDPLNKPIEILTPSSEEPKDYEKEFERLVNDINKGFDVIYDSIDNKEDVIKFFKRIKTNMRSDLGYAISVFTLPWCHLSEADKETKVKVLDDVFQLIKDNGLDCKDCKSCRNSKKHNDDEENE